MPATIAFAATHHDPEELLYHQTRRLLPVLRALYAHLTIVVTSSTPRRTQDMLSEAGCSVFDRGTDLPDEGMSYLGLWRRKALELSLRDSHEAAYIHFCDFDRILHWAEHYPDELRSVLATIPQYDFTVLGRTARAFASHPRIQRDTEAIINHIFALASGQPWDVTAASRGLSRRAAGLIVAGCHDDTIGNDCSWPLFLQRYDHLQLGYRETEGLEFETLDRYSAEELAALGGPAGWFARVDADPRQWARRLDTAKSEVDSIVAYIPASADEQGF